MKKTIICFLSFLIIGCNPKSDNEQAINNNYLFFQSPELKPFSKPIKKQILSGSINQEFTINQQGFITSVVSPEIQSIFNQSSDKAFPVKIDIDYQKSLMIFSQQDQFLLEFYIKFDNDKNMTEIHEAKLPIAWYANYNEQKRLIKLTKKTDPNLITFVSTFLYDQNNLKKIIEETTIKENDETKLMSKNEVEYFYNNNHQIDKKIIYLDDYITKNNQKLECQFYDFNQFGDWTKYYCLKPNENFSFFVLREIEY